MIFFLHGENSFLVERRRRALQEAFLKKHEDAEIFVFDFEDQNSPEHVQKALSAGEAGLFSKEKMIVFLHPYALNDTGAQRLIDFLKNQRKAFSQNFFLVLENKKIKKTHPISNALKKIIDTEETHDVVAPKEEREFIVEELKKFPNVQFTKEALDTLLVLTGGNLPRQRSEIEKLVNYKGEGKVTREDIEYMVAGLNESTIFFALDTLGRGERKKALALFRQEAEKSESIFPLLALCAWYVRRIIMIREAYDNGQKKVSDIASMTKLPPFVVQKAFAVLPAFPLARLKKGITLLSEIDTDLKLGKKDPALALDLFVWKF